VVEGAVGVKGIAEMAAAGVIEAGEGEVVDEEGVVEGEVEGDLHQSCAFQPQTDQDSTKRNSTHGTGDLIFESSASVSVITNLVSAIAFQCRTDYQNHFMCSGIRDCEPNINSDAMQRLRMRYAGHGTSEGQIIATCAATSPIYIIASSSGLPNIAEPGASISM
jgi:hypothetical protein